MGLKPKASLLREGMVEPDWSSSFIENATADKNSIPLYVRDIFSRNNDGCLSIAFNHNTHPVTCAMADNTTSIYIQRLWAAIRLIENMPEYKQAQTTKKRFFAVRGLLCQGLNKKPEAPYMQKRTNRYIENVKK